VDFKLSINQIIVSMLCAELQMIKIVEVFPHLSLLVGGRIITAKPSLLCNAHPFHLAFLRFVSCVLLLYLVRVELATIFNLSGGLIIVSYMELDHIVPSQLWGSGVFHPTCRAMLL
jgi:hypothetical protein